VAKSAVIPLVERDLRESASQVMSPHGHITGRPDQAPAFGSDHLAPT